MSPPVKNPSFPVKVTEVLPAASPFMIGDSIDFPAKAIIFG